MAGIGTGGTITGAGEVLKEKYPDIKIYAVEPADSPVFSVVNQDHIKFKELEQDSFQNVKCEIYDEIIQVKTIKHLNMQEKWLKREGILVGISSGSSYLCSIKSCKKLGKGKKVLAIIPSNGERYLSTPLYQFEEK